MTAKRSLRPEADRLCQADGRVCFGVQAVCLFWTRVFAKALASRLPTVSILTIVNVKVLYALIFDFFAIS